MDFKFSSAYIQLLNPAVFAGLLLVLILPSVVIGIENPKPPDWEDIQMVGVIGPDGSPNLWAVSISNGSDVFSLLAGHSSTIRDGIRYFSLSSWQDMARVLSAVNRHQATVIRQLVENVDQLTKRVGSLERQRRDGVYAGSLDYRLKRLEEKVERNFDGGNP